SSPRLGAWIGLTRSGDVTTVDPSRRRQIIWESRPTNWPAPMVPTASASSRGRGQAALHGSERYPRRDFRPTTIPSRSRSFPPVSSRQMTRRRFSWPLAFVMIALICALLIYFIFDRLTSWPERAFASFTHESTASIAKLRDVLADTFQFRPRVVVRNKVFYES